MKNRVIFSLFALLTGGEAMAHAVGEVASGNALAHLFFSGHHGVPLAITSAVAAAAITGYYFVKVRPGKNGES